MKQEVLEVFERYPKPAREKLLGLRGYIAEVEKSLAVTMVETLKWGEPSYLVSGGSTLRIGWKGESPKKYYVYFNCNSLLVETFREMYSDLFTFEGNRAIVLDVGESLPEKELKSCIGMAFRYHKIKHLPLLGN